MAAGFVDIFRFLLGWWSGTPGSGVPIETHCFAITTSDSFRIDKSDSFAITGTVDATIHSEC